MSARSSPSGSGRGIRDSVDRFFDKIKSPLNRSKSRSKSSQRAGTSSPSARPQSPLNSETTPQTSSNIHLPVPSHVIAHHKSTSAPDLGQGVTAASTPAILQDSTGDATPKIEQAIAIAPGPAQDVTAPSTPVIVQTSISDATPATEIQTQHRNQGPPFDMTALKVALRALDKTARLFPPLQPPIKILQSCFERVQASHENSQGRDDLTSELNNLNEVLEKHSHELEFTSMSACITNVVESINKEVRKLDTRKEGQLTGIMKAHADADELAQCIHRIQKLIRLLKVDVSLSTWSIANELLANTRLEALKPAEEGRYNSGLPKDTGIVRRTCTEGTRTNILFGLNSWSNDLDGPKVYWMNGMAGTGKTTIACSLSAALAERSQLGASFFCTRNLGDCRDVRKIVPTVAYQLARYSRPFQSALCKVLEQDPDIATKLLSTQFERLLKEPLLQVGDAVPSNVVVVIDALDECDDNEGVQTFLNELLRVAPDLAIKFFISSRPEPGIIAEISPTTIGTRSILYLHEIEASLVQADIELYLTKELACEPILASEGQIKQLAQLSGNLFIYAATAVRYIRPPRGNTIVNPQKRLGAVLSIDSGSIMRHKELDMLYTTILAQVLHDQLEVEEVEAAKIVLWTSVCAREPVTVETLAALGGLDTENAGAILESLRSVLHISESNGLVSTLHASFPDFMFTQTRSQQFFCEERSHARLLAQQCFKILQDELRFNICKLESSFVLDKEVKDLEKRVREHISQKLSYACRYWGDHLTLALPANDLCSLLQDFLSRRLLFWLEVLNLSKSSILGKLMLQNIRSWLAPFNDPALPDIMQLTSDCLDFATMLSSNPVMDSTPHIYISLRPFCHKSSLIITRYWGRMQGLLDVKGTAMDRPGSVAVANYDVGTRDLSIAISPDGSVIAFGGVDWNAYHGAGMIGLISQHNGNFLVRPFKAHASKTTSIAFSSDGTRIVSGSVDSTICVWNSKDGTLAVGPFKGHTDWVSSVALSPDGTRVVSGSDDSTICLWNARDGTLAVGPLKGHTRSVRSVAFSPDGTRIASCSYNTIRVWNAQDGECIASLFQGFDRVSCVAFSPCSTRVIFGSVDRAISVWNAIDGKLVLGPLAGHTDVVQSVACSSDGTCFVSGSADTTIRVWNIQDGKLLAGPFRGHTNRVTSVAFSPDNARVVSGSVDGTIRIWNAQGKNSAARIGGEPGEVASAAFSLDRTRVVFGSKDGIISVWNAQDGELVAGPFKAHTEWIRSVAFSPDGAHIVSGSDDKTICVWDATAGTLVAGPIAGHTSRVTSVAFSPGGTRIVSSSDDKTICVWNAQDGNLVAGPFTDPDHSPISSVTFSPDGARIVSGSDEGAICVRNAQDGEVMAGPLKVQTASVYAVAFSPDGTRIVSGSNDETICVWNAQNGTLAVDPLKGHSEGVTSVAFSPDGMHIVSGSWDKTICVWSTRDGKLVAGPFKGHTAPIESVVFSTDGSHILSVSRDYCIHSTKLQNTDLSSSTLQGDWRVKDSGWVVNQKDQYLFWVPPQIRPFLPRLYTSYVVCSEGTLQIDYSNLLLGDSWDQCYIGG